MCVHRNVWPEAVYCCFTRTTLFTKLFTCLYASFIALHFLVLRYCLRLCFFYKNYIVYYSVYCYYCGAFIKNHVYTKFRLGWIVCSYRSVWPEAIYCCFTLFTKLFICLYDQS